jgi:PadR family transcriptional regulator, regulatory protein PadR
MARIRTIGSSEHIILAAAARLSASKKHEVSRACGTAVVQEIEEATGKRMSIGTVCTCLDRLEKRGFLGSKVSDHEGRRPKRYYALTDAGEKKLVELHDAIEAIWKGLKLGKGSDRGSLKLSAASHGGQNTHSPTHRKKKSDPPTLA